MKKQMVLVLMILMLAGCTNAAQGETPDEDVVLCIEPGEHWTRTMWIAFIPVKKAPQLAAWVETEEGEYVTTITVTESSSKQKWAGNPEGGRPESLPVWLHAKTRAAANVDDTTSATPKEGVTAGTDVNGLIEGKRYRILVEVNASYDYNETWPKEAKEGDANYSGVNGQPSLIYETVFIAGESGTVILQTAGQGSVDGSSGEITRNLDGLTTALTIIKSAELVLH